MENKVELLLKIKALAERGIGGERQEAKKRLEVLMLKFGITDEMLGAETVECCWFKYREKLDKRLLNQVIYMVLGNGDTYKRGRYKEVGVYCTAAQRLEIQLAFEFYDRAMWEEMRLFYKAFLSNNDIFPPDNKQRAPLPSDELSHEERFRIAMMMEGVERHSMKKMIESGTEERN